MTVAQLIAEFSQRTWKQPAGFARGDEQRTFDAARDRIGLLEPSGLRIVACLPIEEASFVRVPYSGIANGGGKPGITCCRAGHQRSEEHTSELQSRDNLVCRLLLEQNNN